jgi:hypothetical protein
MTKQPKNDSVKKRKDAFFEKINKKHPDAKVKFDENFAKNLKDYINGKRTVVEKVDEPEIIEEEKPTE